MRDFIRSSIDVAVVLVAWVIPVLAFLVFLVGLHALLSPSRACADEYLGRVGSNPFCGDCTANPFAPIANPFHPKSLNNPFGVYGNPFSAHSPRNPFAADTPKVYGTYGDDSPYENYYESEE
jgi:hypothetical protein